MSRKNKCREFLWKTQEFNDRQTNLQDLIAIPRHDTLQRESEISVNCQKFRSRFADAFSWGGYLGWFVVVRGDGNWTIFDLKWKKLPFG